MVVDVTLKQKYEKLGTFSKHTANNIKLPYIKKGVSVLSAGHWNDTFITADSVRKSYEYSEFNTENSSLYLNHDDDMVNRWVGYVKNIRLKGDKWIGDLEIVDADTAIKIEFGAPFGVSPTLHPLISNADEIGIDGEERFDLFELVSFSIVTEPAMDPNMINEPKMLNKSKFKKWSTKYINDLPDSSFMWIEGGGKLDEEGKTTPRSLRHLPVKDKDGEWDVAHVRNALARLPQVDSLPSDKREEIKKELQEVLKKLDNDLDVNKNDIVDNTTENKNSDYSKQNNNEVKKMAEENEKKDVHTQTEQTTDEEPKGKGEVDNKQDEQPVNNESNDKKDAETPSDDAETKEVIDISGLVTALDALYESHTDNEVKDLARKLSDKLRGGPSSVEVKNELEETNGKLNEVLEQLDKATAKFNDMKALLQEKDKIIGTYQDKIKELEKTVAVFEEEKRAEEMAKRQAWFNEIFENYCNFHSIAQENRGATRERLESMSDEALEMLDSDIKRAQFQQQKSEEIVTKNSAQLNEPITQREETYEEKMNRLFGKLQP